VAAAVRVYAQADTLKYWNAMQAFRERQPIVAGPKGTVQVCNADVGNSDDVYSQRCPAPWLEFNVAPTSATAQLCFPIDYFNWCKLYINEALRQQPSVGASAEARVVWTLDVWAHVTYAQFALNLNWSAEGGGWVSISQHDSPFAPAGKRFVSPTLNRGVASTTSATALVESFGLLAWDQLQGLRSAKDSAVAREKQDGTLVWPAFATLPILWVGDYYARASTKASNPAWRLLLDTVQPWSSNWSRNWIPSYRQKDAAEVAAYASEPVMLMALMQWRMFAARDFSAGGAGEPTLFQYITQVSRQSTMSRVEFIGSAAVPTHVWSENIVAAYAAALLKLDYKLTIGRAYIAHAAAFAPKVTADGRLMTVDEDNTANGRPILGAGKSAQVWSEKGDDLALQFVTFADYRDILKGEKAKATARAQAAIKSPGANCAANDVACQEAAKGYGAIMAEAAKVPVYGPYVAAMQHFAGVLISLVGGAIGAGSFPFSPLNSPAARTLVAPGWSFAPNGSTVDVWIRWAQAVASYETAIPGLFSVAPTTPRKASGTCVTYGIRIKGEAAWCTICKDKALPTCAAYVPEYAALATPKTPPLLAARNAAPASMSTTCDQLAVKWALENPQYADCITVADLPMWQQICRAVGLKQMTVEAGITMWAQYVVSVKGCGLRLPPPKTPRRTATRGFVDAVIVPFNPLRLFGG
jgi:hypothetical protein